MNKLTKRLKRLDNTYKICEFFLKYQNKKYPKKMYYIKLLKEFCKNKQKYYFNKHLLKKDDKNELYLLKML